MNAEERRKFHARERQRRFRERRSAEEIEEAKINDRERARLRRQLWTDEQRAEANRTSREYMRERRRNSAQGLGTSTHLRNLNDSNNELVSTTINPSNSKQITGCRVSGAYLEYQIGEPTVDSLRAQESSYSSSQCHRMSGSMDSALHHGSQKSEIIVSDQCYLPDYRQKIKRPSISAMTTLNGINDSHTHLNTFAPPVHRENRLNQSAGELAAGGARPSLENGGCSKIERSCNPDTSSKLSIETMRRSLHKFQLPPMHVPDDYHSSSHQADPNRLSMNPLIHTRRPGSDLYQGDHVLLGQTTPSQFLPAASLRPYSNSNHSSSRASCECHNVGRGFHEADGDVSRIDTGKIP